MYNWVTMLYNRNWQNSVNQLYLNKNKLKKEIYFIGFVFMVLNVMIHYWLQFYKVDTNKQISSGEH